MNFICFDLLLFFPLGCNNQKVLSRELDLSHREFIPLLVWPRRKIDFVFPSLYKVIVFLDVRRIVYFFLFFRKSHIRGQLFHFRSVQNSIFLCDLRRYCFIAKIMMYKFYDDDKKQLVLLEKKVIFCAKIMGICHKFK